MIHAKGNAILYHMRSDLVANNNMYYFCLNREVSTMLILRRPLNSLWVGIKIPPREQVHSNVSDGPSFFLVQDSMEDQKHTLPI